MALLKRPNQVHMHAFSQRPMRKPNNERNYAASKQPSCTTQGAHVGHASAITQADEELVAESNNTDDNSQGLPEVPW